MSDDGETRVIALIGEMDAACVGSFKEQVRAAQGDSRAIVIDLSGLDFIDSTGIEALVYAVERSRQNGGELGLLRGPFAVDRIFQVFGLADTLPFLN